MVVPTGTIVECQPDYWFLPVLSLISVESKSFRIKSIVVRERWMYSKISEPESDPDLHEKKRVFVFP